MAAKRIFQGLPWWVKWIAAPLLIIAVFSSPITSVVGLVAWLLFRALLLVAIIGGLIYAVRKFTSSSSSSSLSRSSRDDW
ncbi:DUF5326 family protein [Streptomyces zagrosensis]|uniref:DUF5326 family protein n=1 Tax=Streptomyces zagrosensis TaxID=1042984 RepID=A0A7W9Q697_9ACTN|nr:DUF5326 family protein [Streptomyces zagrosensis]MBB5934164.1 hypothetical protein [Streptomyces zagrosensis]